VKYISIVRYTLRLKYSLMFVCRRLGGSRACVGVVCVRVFVCVWVGVGGVVLCVACFHDNLSACQMVSMCMSLCVCASAHVCCLCSADEST